MKRILLSALAASALAVALGWGAATVSAEDKLALVMARRDHMKAQSAAMETIKKYLEGQTDQAAAQKSADDLVKLANGLPDSFPTGTSTDDFPGKSGAKPAIWSDKDKFGEAEKALATQAEKLAAAVKSGDKKVVAEQYGNTGKDGCGNCHTTFRLKLS
jgi:cytochrome c556